MPLFAALSFVQGVERLCGFDRFVNLEVLYLNGNKLPHLDGLEPCFRIKQLYADHNLLTTLEGPIEDMKFLKELDVSYNKLADLDWQLETLQRMQYLETLQLANNPCSQEMGYRPRVLVAIPSLKTLDGQAVTELERVEAARSHGRGNRLDKGAGRRSTATVAATTFGTGRPGLVLSTGFEKTASGRPMFGAEGDTLVQRTLRTEAKAARRAAQVRQRHATLKAIASAGKGAGWAAMMRRARRSGLGDGALRSLLSRRGAGLVEDAVAGSMLSRGCSGGDALNQGLGLLADLSCSASATGTRLAATAASGFDRAAVKASSLAAAARASAPAAAASGAGGGSASLAQPLQRSQATAAQTGQGTGAAEEEAMRRAAGSREWAAVRRRVERVRGATSLTDDLRSVTGSTASGSASATASLMSSIGGALRHARKGRHRGMAVGSQAVAASEAGGVARGKLGEWELVLLKKLFRKADADSSGSLSLPEFRAAVAEAADWGFVPADAADDGVSKADVAAAFAVMDADGSGSVSFAEFVSLLREQARPKGPLVRDGAKATAEKLQLEFRTLTAEEASSRARMHFKTASGIHSRLLRMSSDDPKRERLEKQALQLSEKGSRLTALVRRLEGAADPPERPPPPPKARRDFRTFIQSVPEREARKTLMRGMRDYRVPRPGAESDSDSDDDDGKLDGEDVDDYRKTVRARKHHVVLTTTADI